jgi:purine nucleosidase
MEMNKQKIIIDTDCGSDDAMAIAMALNDERYEVLMITTVSGNVRVDQAAFNTLTTLKMTDSYFPPVYIGRNDMLKRKWYGADDTHGLDGMGDRDLVDYSLRPSEGDAVCEMIKALNENPAGTIDIIALGPLTNLASIIEIDPESLRRARRIIAMATPGNAVGNITPYAEFNVWQDGEAFDRVIKFGHDSLLIVGWSACLDEAMLDEKEIEIIKKTNRLGQYLIEANATLIKLNEMRFEAICLDMADPAAMAVSLLPECIKEIRKCHVSVNLEEGEQYGEVFYDFDKTPNAEVVFSLKDDIFTKYIVDTITKTDERCSSV